MNERFDMISLNYPKMLILINILILDMAFNLMHAKKIYLMAVSLVKT